MSVISVKWTSLRRGLMLSAAISAFLVQPFHAEAWNGQSQNWNGQWNHPPKYYPPATPSGGAGQSSTTGTTGTTGSAGTTSSAGSAGSTGTPTTGVTTPTAPLVAAVTAARFLDSLGVNTHFNFTGTDAYTNVPMMESELQYAGFRYARDTIADHWPLAVVQKVNNDIGTKFDFIMYQDVATELVDMAANSKLITEVEGPNEIDNWPVTYDGSTGPQAAVALQKAIYVGIKGDSILANTPVDSLTISNSSFYPQVGNLSAECDYSSVHSYTQWGSSSSMLGAIEWSVASSATDTPGKSPVITEFGWWTQPMSTGVTQNVQAKSALNWFFAAFNSGVRRSYIYELNDEYSDPQGTDIEKHFGLFGADGSTKVAASALHNMTALLADPSPLTTTTGLPLTVTTTSTAKIYQLLMERGDGVFILALWQDAPLWNTATYQEITVAPQQVLANFGITATSVQLYDPLIGTNIISTQSNVGGLTVMVPDHPVFVFIHK